MIDNRRCAPRFAGLGRFSPRFVFPRAFCDIVQGWTRCVVTGLRCSLGEAGVSDFAFRSGYAVTQVPVEQRIGDHGQAIVGTSDNDEGTIPIRGFVWSGAPGKIVTRLIREAASY